MKVGTGNGWENSSILVWMLLRIVFSVGIKRKWRKYLCTEKVFNCIQYIQTNILCRLRLFTVVMSLIWKEYLYKQYIIISELAWMKDAWIWKPGRFMLLILDLFFKWSIMGIQCNLAIISFLEQERSISISRLSLYPV